MIFWIFHAGSGLGNQLFRYVMTRVLALDKGYKFSMINPEGFLGKFFMQLDTGEPRLGFTVEQGSGRVITQSDLPLWEEKKVVENGVDIRSYDPEINFVGNDIIIDGEFQDERYFEHRLPEIREWLKVEPLYMPDDLCIIGFRGGEYTLYSDLFLPITYWEEAVKMMKEKNSHMKFRIVTDDPELASKLFTFEVTHEIGMDWRQVRYAKHLIIANSSFYILPALLNEDVKEVIAPRFWGKRNKGFWSLNQNYYKKFTYV